MRPRTIITITFFLLALFVSIGGTYYFYHSSNKILTEQVYEHLETTSQNKANWINSYLFERKEDVRILALSPLVKQILNEKELSLEFKQYLQNFKKSKDYQDLFLISVEGEIWWTAEQKPDLGTNLETGPYKDTEFARIYKEVIETGEIKISDTGYYEPGFGLAIFAAAPVYKEDKLIGEIALQIKKEQINQITTDRTGLGETGEAYLVNKNAYLITPSRFIENSLLAQKVDTANSRTCLSMNIQEHYKQTGAFLGYGGERVLGTYIYIPEMQWCLLTEIYEEEIIGISRKELMKTSLTIIILLILLITLAGFLIGKELEDIFYHPFYLEEKEGKVIVKRKKTDKFHPFYLGEIYGKVTARKKIENRFIGFLLKIKLKYLFVFCLIFASVYYAVFTLFFNGWRDVEFFASSILALILIIVLIKFLINKSRGKMKNSGEK